MQIDSNSVPLESLASVTVLEHRDISRDREDLFRCREYVFGHDAKKFIQTLESGVLPPSLMEVEGDDLRRGDLALYYDRGHFMHVGLIQPDGRIVSKWGSGAILIHPVDIVPSRYGDEVRFYRPKTTRP